MSYYDAMKPVGFSKKVVVLICAFALFGAGFFIGRNAVPPVERVTDAVNIETPETIPANFDDFWSVWNTINEKFYDASKVESKKKLEGAIAGLMGSLNDPYSVFFPPKENELFNDMIAGSFGGVGMEIGKQDGAIVVIAPLKDTPAERAGILAGDIVVKINGTSTVDISVDEAVSRIRGDVGTKVHLTISREGHDEFLEKDVVREKIDIPIVSSELRDDGVYVIALYSFDGQSVQKIYNALKEFNASGSKKLILDLRGNPGGILGASVEIASYFLPEGALVVSEKYDQGRKSQEYRSYGYTLVPKDIAMVVLVDKGSASASEILAGALQEQKKATLVGETTFGKGSVQELIPVASNTSVKITVGKWFTPNGVSISDGGLTPDVVVDRTQEDFAAGKDPQMDAAVKLLLKK